MVWSDDKGLRRTKVQNSMSAFSLCRIEEHKEIFRCIREQDVENARIRLRAHLERVQVDSSVVRKAYPQYFKQ